MIRNLEATLYHFFSCWSFLVFFSTINICATLSVKDNLPTSDNSPGTKQYVAAIPDRLVRDVTPFKYSVRDSNRKICILAKFSASFQIPYQSTEGNQNVSVNLPGDAQVEGECGSFQKVAMLKLSWPGFQLVMKFPPGDPDENWDVLAMELHYNMENSIFDKATDKGKKIAHIKEYGLFSTPYGKSYFCSLPDAINMRVDDDVVVLAQMKDIQLQVYDIHKGKFSSIHRCSSDQIGGITESFAQDRSVPVAVKSIVAVVSLVVVLGYI